MPTGTNYTNIEFISEKLSNINIPIPRFSTKNIFLIHYMNFKPVKI